jgi:transposase-like protein
MTFAKRDFEKEQKWRELIKQCKESKLSASAFCRQTGIKVTSLYSWMKVIRERDRLSKTESKRETSQQASSTFVPVRISQEETVRRAPGTRAEISHVEIWLSNGNIIRAGTMSPGAIAELVKSLDATC